MMKPIRALLPALAILLLSSGVAFADNASLKKVDGILVNAAGMTVYTFDQDVAGSGKSACNGPCAGIWPPVAASAEHPAAPYSVVTRDDGSKQLAYNGKPVYLYAADQKPGDRSGDNFKNVWHLVKN
jgi:predicted lipoprotein with Yx(FWY)xxD motif